MVNNVILTGNFKGFSDNNKILLKLETLENLQIVKINIVDNLKDKIAELIREDDVICIKGYIKLDNVHNIIIVATKITFLSKNNKTQN